MSRKWTLILAGLSLLASIACAYLALPPRIETLVATEPVKQLGELGQGVTVPVEFELVNRCPDAVKVVNIIKSCACTSTELSKSSLVPGERATLKVEWSTQAARGPFSSDITVVYSRDGQEQRLLTNLRVEARVIPDIEYQPCQLVFAPGVKARQVITFSPGRDPKAAVVRAYTTHRAFTVRWLPTTSQVEVSFDPPQWSEENPRVEITAETTSLHEQLIYIPVLIGDSK